MELNTGMPGKQTPCEIAWMADLLLKSETLFGPSSLPETMLRMVVVEKLAMLMVAVN